MRITLCFAALLLSFQAAAQDTASRWDGKSQFIASRVGRPFPLTATFPALNASDSVQFGRSGRPAFVAFGFYRCGPCRAAMPHFVTAARSHPATDFVYVTYDSRAVIAQELADKGETLQTMPPNLRIVRMDQSMIRYRGLVLGYPTRYFLHSDGRVAAVTLGGRISQMEREVAEWEALLSGLR